MLMVSKVTPALSGTEGFRMFLWMKSNTLHVGTRCCHWFVCKLWYSRALSACDMISDFGLV